MIPLNGASVLVIGGSSGIGEAVARLCCAAQASVTIASRNPARLEAAGARLGGQVQTTVLDVTDTAACETWLHAHPYDHVVVTASDVHGGPVREISVAQAQAAMDTKFWGAYRVAREARIAEGGSLTLVSGAVAARMKPGRALMSAMTAALETLARGLALDLAPLRVNVVSPGIVQTERLAHVDGTRRQALDAMVSALPLKRLGQPEDVAEVILTCMTNRMMTGAVVYVDGGFTL